MSTNSEVGFDGPRTPGTERLSSLRDAAGRARDGLPFGLDLTDDPEDQT